MSAVTDMPLADPLAASNGPVDEAASTQSTATMNKEDGDAGHGGATDAAGDNGPSRQHTQRTAGPDASSADNLSGIGQDKTAGPAGGEPDAGTSADIASSTAQGAASGTAAAAPDYRVVAGSVEKPAAEDASEPIAGYVQEDHLTAPSGTADNTAVHGAVSGTVKLAPDKRDSVEDSKSPPQEPNPYLQSTKQLLSNAPSGTTPPETVQGLVATHRDSPRGSRTGVVQKPQSKPEPSQAAMDSSNKASKAKPAAASAAARAAVPKLNLAAGKGKTGVTAGTDTASSSIAASSRTKTGTGSARSAAGPPVTPPATEPASASRGKSSIQAKPSSSTNSKPGRLTAPPAGGSGSQTDNKPPAKGIIRTPTDSAKTAAAPRSAASKPAAALKPETSSTRGPGSISARGPSGPVGSTTSISSRGAVRPRSTSGTTGAGWSGAAAPGPVRASGARASGSAGVHNSGRISGLGGLTELTALMSLPAKDAAQVSKAVAYHSAGFHRAIKDLVPKCESKPEELLPLIWQAYQDAWEAERKLRFPEQAGRWSISTQPAASEQPSLPAPVAAPPADVTAAVNAVVAGDIVE